MHVEHSTHMVMICAVCGAHSKMVTTDGISYARDMCHSNEARRAIQEGLDATGFLLVQMRDGGEVDACRECGEHLLERGCTLLAGAGKGGGA
jgi:hypothetical protein